MFSLWSKRPFPKEFLNLVKSVLEKNFDPFKIFHGSHSSYVTIFRNMGLPLQKKR